MTLHVGKDCPVSLMQSCVELHQTPVQFRRNLQESSETPVSTNCTTCDPYGFFPSKQSFSRLRSFGGSPNMYSKPALVWSPAPDPHGKSSGNTSSTRPGSPSSGLVHWMSMMADHNHDVHYMWNGVETKMNTSDQHATPPLQKGPVSGLDDNRASSIEPSQIHGIYGNHGNRTSSSGSPPVSTPSSSGSMVVIPQPINAIAKGPALGSASTNGTGRKYQCKMCPQIFGSKADLQLHTQIHMREAKPYKCSQCSKSFANSSYLSQHTRIHLGIKPYRCEICQRKFTQLSHLQQHIRTHTGDKPYKCRHPGCNKAFSQLSNLQSHSRCHQTDKPYKCNSCYKCFSDEASLLEHIPKHKESKHLKTHICQYCGKSYTQETYLAKHMQKHADRVEKRLLQPSITPPIPSRNQEYWPKQTDRLTNNSHPIHSRASESCLQSTIHLDPRHSLAGNSSSCDHVDLSQVAYDQLTSSNKTTSAFTPLPTGMLPISTGSQLSMGSSSRTYFPYEPINFPKAPAQVTSLDVKSTHNSFPNQLISLHQIRNYASMPGMSGDHPITLKDKNSQ